MRRPHVLKHKRGLVAGAAGLVVLAGLNAALARRAERRHPPKGAFVEAGGVRLHYTDQGAGRPVVLVHGNTVSGDDFATSGVTERLARTNRVIVFDRPGCGHSDRPRGRPWTMPQQAAVLRAALTQLGVHRPVIVGHSLGTLVALAMAEAHPEDTAGLVLASGCYFPTLRLDVPPVAVVAIPGLGDALRYTISPPLGWLLMPLFTRVLFSPAPVTPRFRAEYAPSMVLRPSQIRATAMDGTVMVPGTVTLRGGYGAIAMPVTIMAGDGDKIVSPRHAERLHAAIPGSDLRIVGGAGHMLHHVAPAQVADAVADVLRRSEDPAKPALAAA
jgi:pimeloyl-ACP methyl ester carboxylesterase